jgi:hypothetical protein
VSRILILQSQASPFLALRESLEGEHELIIVSTVEEAMNTLNSEWIDLIISRVHLAEDSIFDFLNRVKKDRHLRFIPFICFCGKLSQHALVLDPVMRKVGLMHGAEKFISLEEYCCEGSCDFEGLRHAIEDCLRGNLRSQPCSMVSHESSANSGAIIRGASAL